MYEAIKDDVKKYTTEPPSIREEMFKVILTQEELEKYNKSKYSMNEVTFWGMIDNYQVIDEDGKTFIRIVDWKTSKSIFVDNSLIRQLKIYAWLLWNVDKNFTDFEVMLYFAKLKANNQLPYSFPSSKIRKTPEFQKINKKQLIEIDKFIKQTTADMIAYVKYREDGGAPKPLKKISKLCAYKDACNDICETYLKANQ
jgi:ubiquitin